MTLPILPPAAPGRGSCCCRCRPRGYTRAEVEAAQAATPWRRFVATAPDHYADITTTADYPGACERPGHAI